MHFMIISLFDMKSMNSQLSLEKKIVTKASLDHFLIKNEITHDLALLKPFYDFMKSWCKLQKKCIFWSSQGDTLMCLKMPAIASTTFKKYLQKGESLQNI